MPEGTTLEAALMGINIAADAVGTTTPAVVPTTTDPYATVGAINKDGEATVTLGGNDGDIDRPHSFHGCAKADADSRSGRR